MTQRSRPDPWFTWARRVVHAGDQPLANDVAARPAPPDASGCRVATRAIHLMLDGHRLRRAGRHREAISRFNLATKQLQPLADRDDAKARWALAWAGLWWAHADYSRGAFARAQRRYGDLLPVMQALGDARGLVAVHRGLGNVAKFLGLYAEAADHYERSVHFALGCGDSIGRAMAEHNLGNVMLALEDFAGAESSYRRAAVGFARTRRRDLLQHAWVNLAEVARATGRPALALRRLSRAEQIGRETAINAGFEAERLIALATCERALGRTSAARATFVRAVALAADVREQHIAALALRGLAELELELGAPVDARATARRAFDLCRRSGTVTELTGALHEITARAAREAGDWQSATRHFEQALDERKRLSTHLAQVRAKTITLHHELNRTRHEAELVRVENARLEEALARIAARLKTVESSARAVSVDEVDAAAFVPLGLSRRESEVLLWLLRGKTNAEIALILGCGAETVKTHLKRTFHRLDVTNRAAAITRAVTFVSASR